MIFLGFLNEFQHIFDDFQNIFFDFHYIFDDLHFIYNDFHYTFTDFLEISKWFWPPCGKKPSTWIKFTLTYPHTDQEKIIRTDQSVIMITRPMVDETRYRKRLQERLLLKGGQIETPMGGTLNMN